VDTLFSRYQYVFSLLGWGEGKGKGNIPEIRSLETGRTSTGYMECVLEMLVQGVEEAIRESLGSGQRI
jgi:hypothetical protein